MGDGDGDGCGCDFFGVVAGMSGWCGIDGALGWYVGEYVCMYMRVGCKVFVVAGI